MSHAAPPYYSSQQDDVPVPPGVVRYQPAPNAGYQPPQTYNPQQYPDQPVYNQQPGQPGIAGAVWIPMPTAMEGVPPGLEYLTMVDTIMIHQIYEVLELLTGWECRNKYSMRNKNGEQVYYAAEESECCERQCCGNQRGFNIHIVDNFRREVIRIVRPFKCCAGGCCWFAFCDCCAQECEIESPPGQVVGTVQQVASGCSSDFIIKNEKGEEIFNIAGPCCCLMCGCQDKEFPISAMNGETVGEINKKWGGCLREAFTDADVFKVSFPMNLDVRMKAVLLGATFLIDFMEFEQQQNKNT